MVAEEEEEEFCMCMGEYLLCGDIYLSTFYAAGCTYKSCCYL